MHGADTELDRQVLDRIKDPSPTWCAIRPITASSRAPNGLQPASPRKPRSALTAIMRAGKIVISIADDGRGLDTSRIRDKALAAGCERSRPRPDVRVAKFRNSFSIPASPPPRPSPASPAAASASTCVRNNIDQIGGTVDVHSVRGQGGELPIKIPLTLASISALIVEHRTVSVFAIPQLFRDRAGSRARQVRASHRAQSRMPRCFACATSCCRWSASAGTPGAGARSGDPRKGFHRLTQVGAQTFGIVVDVVFHTRKSW